LFASDKAVFIYIDNEHIQEYKGRLGRWEHVVSKGKLRVLMKKYGTTEKEICLINNMQRSSLVGQYLFVAYSAEYLHSLEEKGLTRTSISTPADHFIWPIDNVRRVTSVLGLRWGHFHPGLDIPAMKGTPIRAVLEGRVSFVGVRGNYGNLLIVEHRNGFETRYGHNSVNLVRAGDFVKKGQIIAYVGSTGRSTGCHVHFEVRSNAIPLDPLDFLPDKDLQLAHRLKNWKTKE
jgi:murein DD-endopeptidase MepM/ murein hydrolase activator NlpD